MALTDSFPNPLTSPLDFILTTSVALTIYLTILSIYRLFFHPLRQIPGPRYAALTHWYQFYYDVYLRGRFPWYLSTLHKRYGPIVRIGPNEVHILDPEFYHVLYTTGSQKRDKVYFGLAGFGLPDAVLGTVGHDVHRMRRGALAGFFSTKAITNMEPVVRSKLELLARRIGEARGTGQWVDIEAATMSLTTDLITEYSFGVSYDFLEKPNFAPEWARIIMGAAEMSNVGRYVQWLPRLMAKMPVAVVKMLDASLVPLVVFTKDQQEQVKKVKAASTSGEKSGDKPSIIHELLESSLPAPERTVSRVAEEAQTLVAAGSSTTVHFLKTTVYYVLADPAIHERLKAELRGVFSDPNEIPPLHKLEQLPYLSAVVKEGGRMTHGVTSRLTRVAPDQDFTFGEYILPRGTEIGMTNFLQHTNPEIFPHPDEFRPDRWLENPKLERHLVNFSRGARSCLGINLAKVEMYLTLAVLFLRFDMELFETDRSDVELAHDFFIPSARTDSKGVRVLVK